MNPLNPLSPVAKSPEKAVKRPLDKPKLILTLMFMVFVVGIISTALYIDQKFKSFEYTSRGGNIATANTTPKPTWPTFWGTSLSGKYTEFQLGLMGKVEKWEKLSTVEEQRFSQIVKSSTEVNAVVRSKYKAYYPSSN